MKVVSLVCTSISRTVQKRVTSGYILLITFRILFKSSCDGGCQTSNGKKLETLFKNQISSNNFSLSNIPMYIQGQQIGTVLIQITGFLGVTPIRKKD